MKKYRILLCFLLLYAVGCTKQTQEDWVESETEPFAMMQEMESESLWETEETKTEVGETIDTETEPLVPDPDTCLFHSRNGSVY